MTSYETLKLSVWKTEDLTQRMEIEITRKVSDAYRWPYLPCLSRAKSRRFDDALSWKYQIYAPHRDLVSDLHDAGRHCHTNWPDKQGGCAIDIQ